MKTKFNLWGLLLITIGAALTFGGCATAHKTAKTQHEVWDYQVVATPGANGSTTKPTAFLTHHEVWSDQYRGGGSALLADPKASQIVSGHTNQSALGGSSTLNVGDVSSTVSTNAASIIGAGGTAVGNVIGAAKK